METLLAELLADLQIELDVTDQGEIDVLEIKIKNATREVRQIRNYPSSYDETAIVADLEKYYSNIRKLAMYDYNQVGAELQDSHSENGIGRGYSDRAMCIVGVPSFVTLI